MKKSLHLNIDHIATLRQQRCEGYPDIVALTEMALNAGAQGITMHLREDRRHVQDDDIHAISRLIRDLNAQGNNYHLTMEMAATDEMLNIAADIRPDLVTLVPEKRAELTTEGGLLLKGQERQLRQYIQSLHHNELRVSLFIEPDIETIGIARQLGSDSIELHTGQYAQNKAGEFDKIKRAAHYAYELDFQTNAGHGLSVDNLTAILEIPEISELHIGFAVIGRSFYVGLPCAVREIADMLK